MVSDPDSDEEALGSFTRGLIVSDSDSVEAGCRHGSKEPIVLDSDSDLDTNCGEPAYHLQKIV